MTQARAARARALCMRICMQMMEGALGACRSTNEGVLRPPLVLAHCEQSHSMCAIEIRHLRVLGERWMGAASGRAPKNGHAPASLMQIGTGCSRNLARENHTHPTYLLPRRWSKQTRKEERDLVVDCMLRIVNCGLAFRGSLPFGVRGPIATKT